MFLVTAIKGDKQDPAINKLRRLLDRGWYAIRANTPGRTRLQPGDRICFYEAGVGVIAEAVVASAPERREVPLNPDPDKYTWAFQVRDVKYLKEPVEVSSELRKRLEAYKGKHVDWQWGWLFQGTHIVSEHDFKILVGRRESAIHSAP